MSADKQTLSVYDAKVEAYTRRIAQKDAPGLTDFLEALPPDAHILDLGCGPGLAAKKMMMAGHRIDATDGALEMVKRACDLGVNARHAFFDDLDASAVYDGVWANFSLLHLSRTELPKMLTRIHGALRKDGIFHIGMKLGTGSERDALGRFYTYYGEDELDRLLRAAGFTPVSVTKGSGTGLSGTVAKWVVVLSHG